MNIRVTVRGVVVYDNKILCAQLKPYRRAESSEYWCTPGGGIDPNEPLIKALEREMVEETGVMPQVGRLLYVQQYNSSGEQQLEFFFEVLNTSDYLAIDLSKTSHGAEEIELIDFVDPNEVTVLPKFLKQESLRELPATPKFFSYF